VFDSDDLDADVELAARHGGAIEARPVTTCW
jgi:hypothetical protein